VAFPIDLQLSSFFVMLLNLFFLEGVNGSTSYKLIELMIWKIWYVRGKWWEIWGVKDEGKGHFQYLALVFFFLHFFFLHVAKDACDYLYLVWRRRMKDVFLRRI
jgi:hypothetical protein